MAVRGIRGAITVDKNEKDDILEATEELLKIIVKVNKLDIDDIATAIFTVTEDLNAEFPAVAARNIGWDSTPLLCTGEIPVPGSLEKCIRVLLHVNSEKKQRDMVHVYLREAKKLRPDIDIEKMNGYYVS